jgi:hypothetical protein
MKKNNCIYTSFNKAYLPQALLLLESIRTIYGRDIDVIAVLVDEVSIEEKNYFNDFDLIITANSLEILDFEKWIRKLSVVEACTAVKPFALKKLLNDYDTVTYLDPDTYIYSPLNEIYNSNDSWDIALTPHQSVLDIKSFLGIQSELDSYRFGIFNLGFLSVKKSKEGSLLADWWSERCYKYCLSKPELGIFTDQKFFDFAPVIFKNLKIIKSEGYNVATWNIFNRNITINNENIYSNNDLLAFCHFTKINIEGINALNRMETKDNLFRELFYSYKFKLNSLRNKIIMQNNAWIYSIEE